MSQLNEQCTSSQIYWPEPIQEPEWESISFDGAKKLCIRVEISGEDYRRCDETSKIWWANSKKGKYGRGLARTKQDPYKPVRTGLLGQMAFAKVFGESVDLEYREYGDKQDNLIGNRKWDMKCATWKRGTGLIQQTNEYGRRQRIDKDIYVFEYVEHEDRSNQCAVVILVGYMLRTGVLASPVNDGYKGAKHKNHEVSYSDVLSIKDLLEFKQHRFPSTP